MSIIAWIITGLIAGAIAKMIYPGRQGGGILGTMILGIVGAFIGGTLYTLLTTGRLSLAASGFSLGGIIIAILGAIIALWIYYMTTRRAY